MNSVSKTSTLNDATPNHFTYHQHDKSTLSISPQDSVGDAYIFQLRSRFNSTEPSIFLMRQRDSEVVLSATRSGLTSTFEIYNGDTRATSNNDSEKAKAQVTLQLDRPNSVWSLADVSGKETKYAWIKAPGVKVDGVGKISGLLRRNYKLVSQDEPDEVLAIFSSNQASSIAGTIQFEAGGINLGDHFKHLALMTLACQNTRNLQGTNTNPVGNLGALPIGGSS